MHFEDFEALQRTRESCRVYSDKPVSREPPIWWRWPVSLPAPATLSRGVSL